MRISRNIVLAIIVAVSAAACGSGPGPDSISSRPTYSGQTSNCTLLCHNGQSSLSPDPLVTNGSGTAGKHVIHVSSKSVDCEICHFNYLDQPTHMNGTLDTGNPLVTVVTVSISGQTGSWINDTGPGTGSCSNVACHSTAVLAWYGTSGLPTCSSCHVGALDPVLINGSGTAGKHTVHVSSLNIPCAKCHSAYPDAASHMNGALDTADPAVSLVQFDAANPAGAWINDTGLRTGACSGLNCHSNTNLDWYGTNTWTTPTDCATCHDAAVGTRRQVTGAGGDFGQESHHVINYASRTTQVVTSTDCRVCHDMGNHTSGTVRLADKDTSGQVVVYDPATPSSLEPFCLGCHDTDGALTEAAPMMPFSDANTLGTGLNMAGSQIKSYWTNSNPTHKNNGLTCAGTGSPNTGCHGNNGAINMHGSPSRGLLAKNMTFPIAATAAYNANDYQLCFECHANYSTVTKEVVLGYRQGGNYDVVYTSPSPTQGFSMGATPYYTAGIQSLFRDQYIAGDNTRIGAGNVNYNDIIGLPTTYAYMPLHNLHLLSIYQDGLDPSPVGNWFSWSYRGDGAQTGRITCTTCHNVHGTLNAIRNSYDELALERGTGVNFSTDLYTLFPTGLLQPDLLLTAPINCAKSCHNGSLNSYWYSPANE